MQLAELSRSAAGAAPEHEATKHRKCGRSSFYCSMRSRASASGKNQEAFRHAARLRVLA